MRRFEEEEKGLFSLSRVRLNNANKNTRKIDVRKERLVANNDSSRPSMRVYTFFTRRFEEEEKGLFSLSRVRLNNANKNTRKIDARSVPKRAALTRTTPPRDLR